MGVVDVSAAAGSIGFVDDVETQAIGHVVHVIARVGTTAYATNIDGLTWAPWSHVANGVSQFGLANVGGQPVACIIGANGRLRLAPRLSSGEWQDMGDVMNDASYAPGQGSAPSMLTKLDCAGAGQDLEIIALDGSGHAWEATKTPNSWAKLRPIPNNSSYLAFRDIDVANGAGDLQVLGSDGGDLYHAIRASDTWTDFGGAQQWAGDPPGSIVGSATTTILLEVEWLQVTDLGVIWLASRLRTGPTQFGPMIDAAPDGHPFVSVSATTVLPF
jgi:hypothetical protein